MFIKIFKFKLLNQIFIFNMFCDRIYNFKPNKMETEGVTKVKK